MIAHRSLRTANHEPRTANREPARPPREPDDCVMRDEEAARVAARDLHLLACARQLVVSDRVEMMRDRNLDARARLQRDRSELIVVARNAADRALDVRHCRPGAETAAEAHWSASEPAQRL